MSLKSEELNDINKRVRELEKKVAYLEGVLYTFLLSIPVLVMLVLRAAFTRLTSNIQRIIFFCLFLLDCEQDGKVVNNQKPQPIHATPE